MAVRLKRRPLVAGMGAACAPVSMQSCKFVVVVVAAAAVVVVEGKR